MKPQDLIFITVLILLLVFKRRPEWAAALGIICLILSIPLFSFWIFFTAQRLTYYAAGFFTIAITLRALQSPNK